VQVLINVADGRELDRLDPAWCDGVGLVRTELMLRDAADLANEEQQYQAYCRILRWSNGRPVIVRTLDAGGDKPIAGYTVPGEANPVLGLRGLRLSLLHPEALTYAAAGARSGGRARPARDHGADGHLAARDRSGARAARRRDCAFCAT
jgi:phosphoenolpyruvate-protein kinase (PTS system EI component)